MSEPKMKPTLKGSPGMIIDLAQDVKPNKKGVNSLLERFFSRHSFVPKPAESPSEITVINVKETESGPIPVTEVHSYTSSNTECVNSELNKPGAKLQWLKKELQLKMAQKRSEQWKQKEEKQKLNEEELDEDEDEDIIECNEKEQMLDDEESNSGESEPEENDIIIKERTRTKCLYADEEAEEDDEGNEDSEGEEIVGDEDNDDNENDNSNGSDGNIKTLKSLKRIVKAFDDDSNQSNNKETDIDVSNVNFPRTKTDVDMFETDNGNDAWTSDIDDDINIYQHNQLQSDVSQVCKTPLMKTNILSLVSPVTQLTALNSNLNSDKKSSCKKQNMFLIEDSVSLSVEDTPSEKLSYNKVEKRIGLQKKLFADTQDGIRDEDLAQLCSGKFVTQQENDSNLINLTSDSKMTESQLEGLCSGKFDSQIVDMKNLENSSLDVEKEQSQDFSLVLDNNSIPCKKDNVELSSTNNEYVTPSLRIVSSSEEDNVRKTSIVKKKKLTKRKVKQLELSDDEESEGDEEEELDDEDILEEEEDEKFIDYDSEENEVVVIPKHDVKRVAATFLDNEAELSESDWESADEDEKDLDKLEMEEGDKEDIDENKMKSELEKMHMMQLLDEDQREVRFLKELLFEDGDLHSDNSGRERKFKWRNIDKLGLTDDNQDANEEKDVWFDHPEDENELQWRKMRHEREKFLQEKQKDLLDEIGDDLGDSQIFQLGVKALKKIQVTIDKKVNTKDSEPKNPTRPGSITDLLGSTDGRKSHALYKHSLLAKGEKTLARIATIVKDTDKISITNKNARHFIFTHISPSVKEKKDLKDAESDSTEYLKSKFRKRTAPEGITPKSVKKQKVQESSSNRKKLF
ncbi:claspin-like [Prorops nasuta]|uniref:claspin-like n=1 Tax=Prorops nasuta TaxID=863751 RepID=UPI0034CF476C